MAEPQASEGQAEVSDSQGATETAPGASDGQSANQSQATSKGSDNGNADTFFDPKSIQGKPELEAAYKQMQANYTKKMQAIRDSNQKVEAYDSFMSNPEGTLRQLAQQYGYQVVQGGAQDNDDTPQTWDDVYARAEQAVLKKLEPTLNEVKQLKQKNVEQYLDTKYSDWRTYEDDMLGLLKDHPSLSRDPDKLYRLAVPQEIQEQRALRAAQKKLEGTKDSSKVSGPGASTKPTNPAPTGIKSFNDAVEYAKAKLAKDGITPLSA